MKYDVVVIGAGAAGLLAMRELAEAGYHVCMLEAADVAGGRISTIKEGFQRYVEAGAEFIHGKLPLTFKLLKEAGLSYEVVEGKMIGVQNGNWQTEEHDVHWDEFMKQLEKLKTDITILQFLEENFSKPEHLQLRQAVQRFSEGFDLADISKASILSIKDEWRDIEKKQYRIKGGYIQIIDHLVNCCRQLNTEFFFNTCANKIEYENGNVTVYTTDNKKFLGKKLIITVSAGILQSGTIKFKPELTDHAVAIQSLGFGAVIKFLLEFKTCFWKEFDDETGFLLTDEEIPTWWTQLPAESNLLTGWLGGPNSTKKIFEPDTSLLQTALLSLSSIFRIPPAMLQEELTNYKIINWLNQPFIKGGYSYNTLHSKQAINILASPVHDTVYFAGEAISKSESQGTVESALQSGHDTAKMLIEFYEIEEQQ
ncbi:MAG TPA: NAD(P)/FAD-dependent oxidoreductase [Chitinophagaceae bacterium]|nr:NAD(P)/FAD-dependent oxidoreductase [Chitinophagaceae bacterium]